MKFDMKKWREDMLAAPVKTTMPILSFPAVQMMGVSVRQFISNAALMACGMLLPFLFFFILGGKQLIAEKTKKQ